MIAWLQRFSAYLSADDSALISSYLNLDYLYLSPMSLSIQLTCPYVLTHGFHMDCSFVRSRCCYPSTLLVSCATDSCPLIRSLITLSLRLHTLITHCFNSFMHCLLMLIISHVILTLLQVSCMVMAWYGSRAQRQRSRVVTRLFRYIQQQLQYDYLSFDLVYSPVSYTMTLIIFSSFPL